jgi:hypothetical protein
MIYLHLLCRAGCNIRKSTYVHSAESGTIVSNLININKEHTDEQQFIQATRKSFVFLDRMPFSPAKVNLRFGGTRRLHIQGRRVSQVRN